jgi:hypothetical protein
MNHHSYIETMMCMRDGAIGANLQVEVIGRGRVVVPGTGGTVLTAAEIVFRAGLEIVTISSCFVTNQGSAIKSESYHINGGVRGLQRCRVEKWQ